MPITPRFDLSQTDSHIVLKIHVPHVRVSPESVQVVLTDNNTTLHFASPPTYLLVLNFGECYHFHELANESCARYEPMIENGIIVMELQKETRGVFWKNLDLLGRLAPATQRQNIHMTKAASSAHGGVGIRWLQSIEEEQQQTQQLHDHGGEGTTEDATDRVAAVQHAPVESSGYGFLRLFQGIYTDLVRDGLAKEMLELPWIENENDYLTAVNDNSNNHTNAQLRKDRRRKRHEMEQEKFNAERYVGDLDLEDDYIYQCAMAMKPHWEQAFLQMNQDDLLSEQLSSLTVQEQPKPADSCIQVGGSFFTHKERTTLLSIPYPLLPPIITPEQEHGLLMGLLDILYAYTYDHLITDGEPTVESAWTISILSASLSCLDDWFDDDSNNTHENDEVTWRNIALKNVICSSLRRSLVYPYLRNWNFSIHVWNSAMLMVQEGVRPVLRSLLQTRSILDKSELYYMGNKLFIDPYLAWLQAHPDTIEQRLKVVAEEMRQILQSKSLKDDVQLDLLKLETSERSDNDSYESSSNESDSESSYETDSDGDDDSSCSSNENETNDRQAELATRVDGQTMPNDDTSKEVDMSSSLLDDNLGSSIEKISLSVSTAKKEESRRSVIEEID